MFSVFDIFPIYTFTVFMCFVIFYLSLSFLALMHFYHMFLVCSISSFRYVYHIFISYMTFMVIYYTICYILCSCTVFMYSAHILFFCYTFHITFSFILTFQISFHSYTFSYITSDRIISCYRTYHHIAMPCFSDHIISFHMSYSNNLFYETVVLSGPGGTVIIVQDNDHLIKARRRCGDPFGATVIQTGSMSSTQTGSRYQNRTCMLQTYSLLACQSIPLLGQTQAIHFITFSVHIL